MTEPPDPRHPEDGGGEEDYEAAWENTDADEIMDGLEDDALLDLIAQGVRGELGPDALTELLAELRDRPDDHDIPMPNTARVERGENVLPPRQPEGSTPAMSLADVVARLQAVANNSASAAALAQAQAHLSDTVLPLIQQAIQELVENKNTAAAELDVTNSSLSAAVGGAAEHAGNAIEDAMALVQQAHAGLAQAIDHEGVFRQAALDAANQLASG